jgi:hypothetical protein
MVWTLALAFSEEGSSRCREGIRTRSVQSLTGPSDVRFRHNGRMPRVETKGLSYADLRKQCLDAIRLWPGCETIGGIRIIRENNGRFSVRVTLYGDADKRLADRAIRAIEREKRRFIHLTE